MIGLQNTYDIRVKKFNKKISPHGPLTTSSVTGKKAIEKIFI